MPLFDRHSRFRDRLSAYIDAQLSPGEIRALESHLHGCDACRSELDELRIAISAVRDLPQAEVPRSFALTQAMAGTRASVPAWSGSTVFARYAAASLTMALAAVLVFDLADTRGSDGNDTSSVAERVAIKGEDSANLDADAAETAADAAAPAASVDPGASQAFGLTGDDAANRAANCAAPSEGIVEPPATPAAATSQPVEPLSQATSSPVSGEAADGGGQGTDACLSGGTALPEAVGELEPASEPSAEPADQARESASTAGEDDGGFSTLRLIEITLAVALAVVVTGLVTAAVGRGRRS